MKKNKKSVKYKRNKTRGKNKSKNKTIKKNNNLKTIDKIKGNISVENINSKKSFLINDRNKIKIELLNKFTGGKSGDLVYLIKDKKKQYVMKIFMNSVSGNHEIKLHNKYYRIFKNVIMIPELFSYGNISNIPFLDKKGKFKYMIMEYINNPIELSDYIQKNCKSIKNKDINSYNLAMQLFY